MAQIGQIGQNFAVLLALACISTAAATTGLPGIAYAQPCQANQTGSCLGEYYCNPNSQCACNPETPVNCGGGKCVNITVAQCPGIPNVSDYPVFGFGEPCVGLNDCLLDYTCDSTFHCVCDYTWEEKSINCGHGRCAANATQCSILFPGPAPSPAVSGAAIGGIVAGCVVGAAFFAGVIVGSVIMMRRRQREQRRQASFMSWEIDPGSIEIMKKPDGEDWLLGRGASGRVYKAKLRGIDNVAVKYVDGEIPHELETLRKEVDLLRSCKHENIVMFLGACLDKNPIFLVTQLMERGDLCGAIRRDAATPRLLGWNGRGRLGRRIALDVARGLAFLHYNNVIHLDLKSPNVLLDTAWRAKITDVGMARVLKNSLIGTLGGKGQGTFGWMSPEIFEEGVPHSKAADVYSLGVVLWEICSGDLPERNYKRPLRIPDECPQGVADLIADCMSQKPEARPTSFEVVERLEVLVVGRTSSGALSQSLSGLNPNFSPPQRVTV